MKLLFEESRPGRRNDYLPESSTPAVSLPEGMRRSAPPHLPQIAECDLARHYSALARRTHGVNDGFYPLGSCTMKYNPKLNDEMAALPGFAKIHPLQPPETARGCIEVLQLAEKYLCEITGMDAMTFQPAAGAHGEFTGLLLIKKYHELRGDTKRTKIIVPDSAHGTNPASAAMAGMSIVNVPSGRDGCVSLSDLREAVGEDTAGLMLTNPNTVGLFDQNILEITKIVHDAGGLCYYDGANLNAVMGVVRPGDMGFDCVHLNLHKTFSTPHGGGGPGAGPVGCKEFLAPYLPKPQIAPSGLSNDAPQSIGQVKSFYGNFLVVVKALAYLLTLGAEGVREASENAVLNANYLMHKLASQYEMAYRRPCMHEFVMTLEPLKKECGVTAMDIAKSLLDAGMHPPTMYFPLIVHEALMVEPTETESPETLDEASRIFLDSIQKARKNPDCMHELPLHTPVRRLDEVGAARNPRLRYRFGENDG
ncbi:aminomethyl-transferring glycine dehydrogenase subunit GcvPB [Anaerotruncus rubiinfantis]|uniref:aminomethyl-transferring glycine dehydrogenase subunit GcvPB n=1 Tax=Anaerotruncus rubiinfantis TaxID=1720200 RepID=UPI0034A38961